MDLIPLTTNFKESISTHMLDKGLNSKVRRNTNVLVDPSVIQQSFFFLHSSKLNYHYTKKNQIYQ